MKMANLHKINKLLVDEAEKTVFDEVSMTMSLIANKVGLEEPLAVSRYIAKLEELEKISVIRTPNKTNQYVIKDKEVLPENYMELLTEKQHATIRHFCYKYGISVFKAIAKSLNATIWIDNLTVEQAHDIISYYNSNKEKIVCDFDDWIKTLSAFPQQYTYSHYEDFVEDGVEKTIIAPIEVLKWVVATLPCALLHKDTKVFHLTTYCYTHFDLIYLGYKHNSYQGKDYYFYP